MKSKCMQIRLGKLEVNRKNKTRETPNTAAGHSPPTSQQNFFTSILIVDLRLPLCGARTDERGGDTTGWGDVPPTAPSKTLLCPSAWKI